MQEKIKVDTVGMLCTLQAMTYSALCGASKVDGILALIGYGLAASCFLLFVTLLVLSIKDSADHELKPKDRK